LYRKPRIGPPLGPNGVVGESAAAFLQKAETPKRKINICLKKTAYILSTSTKREKTAYILFTRPIFFTPKIMRNFFGLPSNFKLLVVK
jgi:hypothetical protein